MTVGRRRPDSSMSDVGGSGRRQERAADVRGASAARPHCAVLDHRRQRYRRHRGSRDRRVLVTQHGQLVTDKDQQFNINTPSWSNAVALSLHFLDEFLFC